jgi:hypothetical protein
MPIPRGDSGSAAHVAGTAAESNDTYLHNLRMCRKLLPFPNGVCYARLQQDTVHIRDVSVLPSIMMG